MRLLFILSLLIINFAASIPVFAESNLNTDQRDLELKTIDETLISKYKNDRDFDYQEKVKVKEGAGLLAWISYYFQRLIYKILSNKYLYNTIVFILILFFVLIVFLILTKTKLSSLFYRAKSTGKKLEFIEVENNIEESDLDMLIQQEIANKNFRKAVRYYYLKILKILNEKGMINWEPSKTNRDYYYELYNSGHENSFSKLSFAYEYVWYGDFEIGANEFLNIEGEFKNFNSNIGKIK